MPQPPGVSRSATKVFEVETYGENVTYLSRDYPEASRRLIQTRIRDQLCAAGRAEVEGWLVEAGLDCFLPSAGLGPPPSAQG